jgi:hypothetical protein
MITTIRRHVQKRCPFKDEMDSGELVIVFDGTAPELHQLAKEVDSLASNPISHENFTGQLAAILPPGTSVTTTWNTGPWSVEVRET